ncbi:MAG: hypothetical protein U0929_16980 [Planctomycetaceae bacterium]
MRTLLANEGFSPVYGARPLRRVIQETDCRTALANCPPRRRIPSRLDHPRQRATRRVDVRYGLMQGRSPMTTRTAGQPAVLAGEVKFKRGNDCVAGRGRFTAEGRGGSQRGEVAGWLARDPTGMR